MMLRVDTIGALAGFLMQPAPVWALLACCVLLLIYANREVL